MGVGRTAEVLAWGDDLVLKLFYEGYPARWAEAEALATRSVQREGLPVPRVEGVTEVDGRSGIIFQRVDGPSMLAYVSRPPWPVTRMAHVLADLHARMHALRLPELPPLQSALEERIQNALGLSAEEKEAVLGALAVLPEGEGVCHMDFHPDNVLMSPDGPVIIDWMDAHTGHPLADAARTLLMLQMGEPPPGTSGRWLINLLRRRFHRAYLKRYGRLRPAPAADLKAWRLPIAAARLGDGIPEERDRLLAMVRADLSARP
ncbi:MAG: aminoglycoside phosphotransferase family protein [Thermoplasmata archaeon]